MTNKIKTVEVKVPVLPESVSDAVVSNWYKQVGDTVTQDENLVDLETDKVMLEVPASASGVIKSLQVQTGDTVTADTVLAVIEEGVVATQQATTSSDNAVVVEKSAAKQPINMQQDDLSPAVRRLVSEHNLTASDIKGTGKDGRISKEDVMAYINNSASNNMAAPLMSTRTEERVPMSRLRAKIAERLVAVKTSTAMLTTFNEVNMQPVMDLRAKYKEQFEKKHGARLGFMSFFVKATVAALKEFPAVNASIDGNDVLYHNYFDIGIAVSSPRGLVVPVLRDANQMGQAKVESSIVGYANKAKEGKLTIEEMTGGTFTITNGGVFGSMLSTPILNPPQSAILGMHNIVKRAVVESDKNGDHIVVRPMMYLALSYDHRIVDGKESVSFLKMIKELIEDPARIILDL